MSNVAPLRTPEPEVNRSAAIFGRYLDLTALRGRRRGLVRCRFHDDRTGSLSVDLDRGLFHCFGCGVGGGVNRFEELVGERVETVTRSSRPRSLLAAARMRVLGEAQRQHEKLKPYRDLFITSDFIRARLQLADRTRRAATVVGPSERVWDLLGEVARLETEALAVVAEVDAILGEGRLA